MDKYRSDLDITNIVHTLNKTKVLVECLMNAHQKELLKYSQALTIHDNSLGK